MEANDYKAMDPWELAAAALCELVKDINIQPNLMMRRQFTNWALVFR